MHDHEFAGPVTIYKSKTVNMYKVLIYHNLNVNMSIYTACIIISLLQQFEIKKVM